MTVRTHSHNVSFTSKDGLKLAGEFCGDPKNPPVLLLHGGGQTRHAWKKTQTALASAGFYSLAMDLRGHGESDYPADPAAYSEAATVADMAALLDAVGADKAIIGGLSLGG